MVPNVRLIVLTLIMFLNAANTVLGQEKQTQSCSETANIPSIGVDNAGAYLMHKYNKDCWRHPVYSAALSDLGAEFICDHYGARIMTGGSSEENRKKTITQLNEYTMFLKENNLKFLWNSEHANWIERSEYEPGKNFYEPQPGLHYFKLPPELLEVCRQSNVMVGVIYDEFEHMQLSNNQWTKPDATGDIPCMVNTTGMSLPDAYEALVKKASELKKYYQSYNAVCAVESVWPVMHHIFARAGWTICPKLLKESWHPVVISMGLGAAIEYADNGADLWFSPDLWFLGNYPGHSVEELRSALLAAHWLGAGRIYVEDLDYVHSGTTHPDAKGQFGSLVGFTSPQTYTLTAYGKVLQWYAKQYRPSHPRPYSWKEARCKIAIVRFPDSCWGARGGYHRDRLLGAKDQQSTPVTEAWFKIWHLLSKGTIPTTGLSFNSHHIQDWPPRFFCPTPSVLVFDHRIADEHPNFDFRGAKVIFLTGITVTSATQELIKKQVSEGTTCISLPALVPEDIRKKYQESGQNTFILPHNRGKWIVTGDFLDKQVADAVADYLPPDDEMQYIFADHSLIFKRIGDDNNRIKILLDGTEVAP